MNRRIFLRNSISASVAPVFLTGFGSQMLNASVLPASFSNNNYDDRCLVILYMAGGNDIVNTVLPLDQYDTYACHRPLVRLDDCDFLQLAANPINCSAQNPVICNVNGQNVDVNAGNDLENFANAGLGFHPSLGGLKSLFDANQLKLIQRVGYDQVNGSHFSAESILLRGIDGTSGNSAEKEGWIARFLRERYPQYAGVPFSGQLDPLGVCFSNPVKLGFHSQEEHNYHLNLTNQNPGELYNTVSGISGSPITEFGDNCIDEMLQYATLIEKSTQVYSNRIQCVFEHGNGSIETVPNDQPQYPETDLASQFKTVSRLLKGGSKTKVFMLQVGGFDTHVSQLETHAQLLQNVSDSITAFQAELTKNNLQDQVLTVAFSEFGRKVIDNGGGGTDHGTLSSMFVIGDGLNTDTNRIFGDNLDLGFLNNQGAPDPDQMQHDYRTVYSKILKEWFGADNNAIVNTFAPDGCDPIGNDCTSNTTCSNYNPVASECGMDSLIADPAPTFAPPLSYNLNLNLTVMLEGFKLAGSNEMNTNLLNNNLIPLKQPYQATRFSYFGSEEVASIPSEIVDWVYVEIYDAAAGVTGIDLCPEPLDNPNEEEALFVNTAPVAKKALFIDKAGRLTELDGSPGVSFHLFPGTYKLYLYHRSHLGILVDQDIIVVDADKNLNLNLTNGSTKAVGNKQLKNLEGVYCMIAGDVDQNGVINNKDQNLIKRNNNTAGYKATDLEGDGTTDNSDLILWKGNKSKIGEPLAHKLIK